MRRRVLWLDKLEGVVVVVISGYNVQLHCVSVRLLADFTSENETQSKHTLCSVRAIAPSMVASSQPALHMTAGFGD